MQRSHRRDSRGDALQILRCFVNPFKKLLSAALTSALTLPVLSFSAAATSIDGRIVETNSNLPIAGAFVTLGDSSVRTDKNGAFHIEGDGTELRARAYGYKRGALSLAPAAATTAETAPADAQTADMAAPADTDKPAAGGEQPGAEPATQADQPATVADSSGPAAATVRAPAAQNSGASAAPSRTAPVTLQLEPFTPRGIYLSSYGISSLKLRNAALDLVHNTQINTFVIDVKTDSALVTQKSAVPLAKEIGAQKIVLKKDLPELIAKLHAQGIYTIARIVTFKDTLLAQAHPEWAIKTADGKIFRDNEGLAWVDPFVTQVWDYNVALAREAAQMGFDEIQFDYVRFPDKRGLVFSKPNTEQNRVAAINGLLTEARATLRPYNVFLAADIFGYVCWNQNDTEIGQRIEDIMQHVDYASPMLYPSGFQFGIPGYRNPVESSNQIVYRTLENARARTHVDPVRFRPWLQAFRDYAFDRRQFGQDEIQQQISAAERFGSNGWLLWNPRNVYAAADIKRATPALTAENEEKSSAMR